MSSETVRGGVWVNDKREAKGLNRLTILTVERSAAATCSSTYLRQYLSSHPPATSQPFDASAAADLLVAAWASKGHGLLPSLADVPHPPSINEVYDVHDAMRCHPRVKETLGGCAGFKVRQPKTAPLYEHCESTFRCLRKIGYSCWRFSRLVASALRLTQQQMSPCRLSVEYWSVLACTTFQSPHPLPLQLLEALAARIFS